MKKIIMGIKSDLDIIFDFCFIIILSSIAIVICSDKLLLLLQVLHTLNNKQKIDFNFKKIFSGIFFYLYALFFMIAF